MPQTAVKQSMLLTLVLLSMLTCLAHAYTPHGITISPHVKRAALLAKSQRQNATHNTTENETHNTTENETHNTTENATQNATKKEKPGTPSWQLPSTASIIANFGGAASNIGDTVVSCWMYMWNMVPPILPQAVLNYMMCKQCTTHPYDWLLPGCQFTAPGYVWSVCDEEKYVKYNVDDANLFMMCAHVWFFCFLCSNALKAAEVYIESKSKWPHQIVLLLRCYIALNFCKVPWTVYAVWQRQKGIEEIAWTMFDKISTIVLSSMTGGTYTAMGAALLSAVLSTCTEQVKTIQKHKWLACVEGGLKCFEYLLCMLECNPLQEAIIEWLIPMLKEQDTQQSKSKRNNHTARAKSPGRKASVEQFQFRVLRVYDKNGTDISQKQDGDVILNHREYKKPDCYLQCYIMTEDGEKAENDFPYNEIRKSWTHPEYIKAAALDGFEFRYDASESLLDMKMPQGKQSFHAAAKALENQNGLYMKWLHQ